jgi:hypothetical protein
MSLIEKIVSSSKKENAINKRSSDKSYNANIQANKIKNEGISTYQEAEKARPYMIDGEARKCMGADYTPEFPVPFESLKSTDEIEAIITRYRQGRTDTGNEIAIIDNEI